MTKLLITLLCLVLTDLASASAPTWVMDPAVPGPDIPSLGQSAFDALTLDAHGKRDVPFPFERLISRIEAAAGCKDDRRCTRAALIPLGRSLQRVVASPNFFAHPRVVVAVTDEGDAKLLLRDRLFLGYQDVQGVIEVISYNEALGRFEFQVVKNYRQGTRPQVFQARRTVCVSCHQNHAPIFSRQVWSETNANPQVSAALAHQSANFFGVDAQGASEISNSIDDATDRANRLSLTQALWRDGCGVGAVGNACRRASLLAALRMALSGERISLDDPVLRETMVEPMRSSALRRWPGGLAIPSPDIPNRDPFAQPIGSDGVAAAHIPARLEPLALRAPLQIVPADGEALAHELIEGLTATWSDARLVALDRLLLSRSAPVRMIDVPCRIAREAGRAAFICESGEGAMAAELSGSLTASQISVDSIRVDGVAPLRFVQASQVHVSPQHVSFTPWRIKDRSLRTARGGALEKIELQWSGSVGTARLRLRDDLDASFIDAATLATYSPVSINEVTEDTRRSAELAPAEVEPTSAAVNVGLAADLEPHCGGCHRTPDAMPANFLTGDARQVQRQLIACAPRLYVRLAMNEVSLAHRAKTPMPPESAHRDAAGARAIENLRNRVAGLLRQEFGRVPSLDELLSPGYERLRPCSDPSQSVH